MPGDNKRRANELVATAAIPVAALLFIVGTLLAGIVVGIVVAVVGTAAVVLLLQRTALATVRRVVGGRPADPIADARLVNLIDNLASSAGVPAPELLVVDDAAPNALAAGLEPRTAVVAVTIGLLDLLDRV